MLDPVASMPKSSEVSGMNQRLGPCVSEVVYTVTANNKYSFDLINCESFSCFDTCSSALVETVRRAQQSQLRKLKHKLFFSKRG